MKKNTEKTKKTTTKKNTTKSKLKTAKLITEKNMLCFGNFTPCDKCNKCQFSAGCFDSMKKNIIKNNRPTKKTKKTTINGSKIAFLALMAGGFKVQNIGDVCKRFTDLAKLTGLKNAPKSVLQSLNTLLANHENNRYMKNSGCRVVTNENFQLIVTGNHHAGQYLVK